MLERHGRGRVGASARNRNGAALGGRRIARADGASPGARRLDRLGHGIGRAMILVMVRVMALGLWRDRAGLVLVFVLPPLVFIVFATVFSAGASGRLDIRVGVVDQIGGPDSQRLVDSLQRRLGGRLTRSPNVAALEDAIKSGQV